MILRKRGGRNMAKTHPEDLDWNKLGFKYHDLPYRWVDEFKDGKWQGGHLTHPKRTVSL